MQFYFLWFHTMAIQFLFLRWYVNPKHPAFYGHVHLPRSQAHHHSFPLYCMNTSFNPSRNTCVLFLWTKANWSRNDPSLSWLNYVSLDCAYLTTTSSVGAVWVVHAYVNENSTHRSETKITDKCFEILFLIFLHYIQHEKCINHDVKCRGHDK